MPKLVIEHIPEDTYRRLVRLRERLGCGSWAELLEALLDIAEAPREPPLRFGRYIVRYGCGGRGREGEVEGPGA